MEIREVTNKSEWEAFLAKHSEANFLQSWYWGDFHEALRKKVYRRGAFEDGKLVAVSLLIVEPARRGKYIAVPAGPIMDWNNKPLREAVVKDIKNIAQDESCVFVRIRPAISPSEENLQMFKELGLRFAPTFLHAELTMRVDLHNSLETLLSNMRKQTRAMVRKAEKVGVKVTSTTNPLALKQFYELQMETATRQGFVAFSYRFLYEQFRVFAEAGLVKLYTATFEDKILAQAFIIFYGSESAYHYGASTDEGRKYPGAYAIQWEVMKEAKERGMHYHNFWGVAREDEKNHRFYPISIFKRGFGGEELEYLHAHDMIINKSRYLLNYIVEYARKVFRRV
ncbi:MAG: peptidoglycan bridge formation glycyltransferase FemA/FemB family protein [Candidatus Pacebacteria bacterium]|nr:peptidoglycan bridge formation glycyltransferase FemA/FemB family protein [Candidatus Paceibacterota bacterium]